MYCIGVLSVSMLSIWKTSIPLTHIYST
jgi:hypothetical protein